MAHKLCAFHGLKIKKYFYHNSKILDFSLSFSYKHTVAFSREYVIDHLITEIKCWGDLRGWLGNSFTISFGTLWMLYCAYLLSYCEERKKLRQLKNCQGDWKPVLSLLALLHTAFLLFQRTWAKSRLYGQEEGSALPRQKVEGEKAIHSGVFGVKSITHFFCLTQTLII